MDLCWLRKWKSINGEILQYYKELTMTVVTERVVGTWNKFQCEQKCFKHHLPHILPI